MFDSVRICLMSDRLTVSESIFVDVDADGYGGGSSEEGCGGGGVGFDDPKNIVLLLPVLKSVGLL